MEAAITEEIIARQPPEAQAIIRLLLARIAVGGRECGVEGADRGIGTAGERQDAAELLAAAQHAASPCAAAAAETQIEAETRRAARPRETRAALDSHRAVRRTCAAASRPNAGAAARSSRGQRPEPLRHQVWEVPEIKPHVTEYQRHRLTCPCCGETTCAELPPGVPQGQSGRG